MRKDESGQAMALGVMGLLLLAIGMYMTATFGRHVQQKIHVQTTADVTALSLAQLEAQSFNYIAFANRAQVAHYVTIMNLNAYVSYMSAIEHWAIYTAQIMNAVSVLGKLCVFPVCAPVQALSTQLGAAAQQLFTLYQSMNGPINAADDIVLTAVPVIEKLNTALWVSEMAMVAVVAGHLAVGGHEVFRQVTKQNDPSWQVTKPQLAFDVLTGAYNLLQYKNAFSADGGSPFSGSTPNDRAKRVMTEVVNATRYDESLLKRNIRFEPFASIANTLNDSLGFSGLHFGGETKLVGDPGGQPKDKIEAIFSQQLGIGTLSTGEGLASADEWLWGKGSVWVKASGEASHCRAKQGVTLSAVGSLVDIVKSIGTGTPLYQDCTDDGKHSYGGISPYMIYQAGNDADADKAGGAFHEPTVCVWLHKSAEQADFSNTVNFTWQSKKRGNITVDTSLGHSWEDISKQMGLSSALAGEITGVHAFATAEAYYHRPGNWAEPPNLFNPFWRARLAPVIDGTEMRCAPDLENITAIVGKTLVFH